MGITADPTAVRVFKKKKKRPTDQLARYQSKVKVARVAEDGDEAQEILLKQEEALEISRLKKAELNKLLAAPANDGDGPVILDAAQGEIAALMEQTQKEALKERIKAAGPLRKEAEAVFRTKERAANFLQRKLKEKEDKKNEEIEQSTDLADSVIYRDASGSRITRDEWEEQLSMNKVSREKDPSKLSGVPWAKGLVQLRGPKAEEEGVDRFRAEDPMAPKKVAHFVTPTNRFNIPAGKRWDGVVRGNGYEARYLRALNEVRREEKNRGQVE